MAIKKFSAFVAETTIAADYVAPKDDDKEVKGYKPRAKGEEDFANKHVIQKHDYPVDVEAQFTGGNTQKPRQPNNGEKPVKQGSTDVNQPQGGGNSKRTADRKQGDMKPVNPVKESVELDELKKYDKNADFRLLNRLAQKAKSGQLTSAEKQQMANAKARLRNHGVTEDVDLSEGKVMDALEKIVKDKSAGTVKFANGKTLRVDMTTANAMLNLHKKINDQNKKKMEDQIEKSPDVFMRLMDVAFGGN
jgi:hypothetical protein